MRELLKKGEDNNMTHNGKSAVHWTYYSGHSETVNFLLAKGAKANVFNRQGQMPIMTARKGKK